MKKNRKVALGIALAMAISTMSSAVYTPAANGLLIAPNTSVAKENLITLGTEENHSLTKIELKRKETITLNVYGMSQWQKEDMEYRWTVDGTAVTVDDNGVVKAVKIGTAIVNLTIQDKKTGILYEAVPVTIVVPKNIIINKDQKPIVTTTPKPIEKPLKPVVTRIPNKPIIPSVTKVPKPTTKPLNPTITEKPKVTVTNTPVPTVISTPKPVATSTPVPTATSTPKPTATSTPIPIEQFGVDTAYHTKEEVKNYMATSGADATISKTTTISDISFENPYQAGIVSKEYLNDALNMLNQIRYIAGLSNNVALNSTYTELAQAGSFLNAVNGQLSHTPSKVDDMNSALYNKGYEGASSSNIAWSSGNMTIARSILLWMDDSDNSNIDRVGHRRWILNPSMEETGFGYAKGDRGTYTSMYAFDNAFTTTDIRGVAWPAREMPLKYFGNNMAWSYSYGEKVYDIEVQLSCLTEGKEQVWNFSESSSDGYFNVENSNYGKPGCVIFRPDEISISDGDSYLVTITQSGELLAQYVVNFFE